MDFFAERELLPQKDVYRRERGDREDIS